MLTVRGPQSNYESTAGGSTPVGSHVRNLGPYARSLMPRKTPLLTKIGFGDPIMYDPVRWGQHKRTVLEFTLGANLGNNGGVAGFTGADTSITAASGQGVSMTRNAVLKVTDYVAGSVPARLDPTTSELIWLQNDASGDTATGIYRGYGGTTPVAHTSGALIEIVGVAEPQLSTHAIGPVVWGIEFYNEFQRFSERLAWDRAQQNTATYEFPNGSPKAYQVEEKTLELKKKLERSIYNGRRQAGSQLNPPVPSAFGGIDQFLVTNVTNANGTKLTPRGIETELRRLWKTTDDGAAKTLLMDFDTAACFDGWGQSIAQRDMSDTTLTYMVNKVRFREGIYDIAVTRDVPPATIYGVNLGDMKIHPRKGNDWTLQKFDGDANVVARDEWAIYGDFTFVLKNEEAMFKLYNFNIDPAFYPINS